MNRFVIGLAGLAIAAGTAQAAFLGISIREDKSLPAAANLPAGLRVFNLYAMFDGPGTVDGPGRVNTVVSVGQPSLNEFFGINLDLNPGANFFQATAGQGAAASNVGAVNFASFGNTRGLYDTFMSIGLKLQDPEGLEGPVLEDSSTPDPDFAMLNFDGVAGAASLGLGAGHDRVRGGWFNSNPPSLQGAARDNGSGEFLTFLGQFSIAGVAADNELGFTESAGVFVSEIFAGELTVYTQAAGSGADPNRVQILVPTPGALALFGVAGLAGARRRR